MTSHQPISRREYLLGSLASAAATVLAQTPKTVNRLPDKPNLIFFFPDQLRAESLACYGHPLVETPNVDHLASGGVRFGHCQSAYPVCTASRCSLVTGWPPHTRGHRSVYYLLRPDEPNLFRYLKQGGYDVYWYGKNDILTHDCFKTDVTESSSFADGFEWDVKNRPWPPGHPHYYSFLFNEGRDRRDYPDYRRVQAGIRVLEQRERDKPFLLYLPLFFPHPPFSAPKGFHDKYSPKDIPPLRPPKLDRKPEVYRAIRRSRGLDRLGETDLRRINAVYLGMISYTDWLLGELLEAMERTGNARRTVFIFASDHGEWAGDYGLVEKWSNAMDDALLRVPLIIQTPGGRTGHVIEGQVELFDIMATCLELAGIEPQHTHFAQSLIDEVRGGRSRPDRPVFAEGGYNTYEPQCFEPLELFEESHIYYPKILLENRRPELITRTTMIRTREYKLALRPDGESELYDLRDDPMELNNLFGWREFRGIEMSLRVQMLDWYVRTSDVVPPGRDPRGLPPEPRRN